MRKMIVNPCVCDVYSGRATVYASIEYSDDGRLSICGVVEPLRNGNCRGSCGQCVDEIRSGDPVKGWTDEMLKKFCDIWDRWHFNDMRPYCEHQRQLGWNELAEKEVTLYHYSLTTDALKQKSAAEKAATGALRRGETFSPTEEQVMLANLPYSKESYVELCGDALTYYEPKKALHPGVQGSTETKALGWIYQNQHPDGLLCRPCPVCGYKYGSAWRKEEVPQEVIDWLFALPETEKEPAWV